MNERKNSREKVKLLDAACALVGAGAVVACLAGCSPVEKVKQPAQLSSIEVSTALTASPRDEQAARVSVTITNPAYAPAGMEALPSAAIGQIEDKLSGRLATAGVTENVKVKLKKGTADEGRQTYQIRVPGAETYYAKVYSNGAVILLTQQEQAEQEARDAEDEAEKREMEAAEENARFQVSDAAALKKAGVPAKCAETLSASFAKWCKKQKLQTTGYLKADDISIAGKSCTINLLAVANKGEEKETTCRVIATWDGKKLTFAKKKGGAE